MKKLSEINNDIRFLTGRKSSFGLTQTIPNRLPINCEVKSTPTTIENASSLSQQITIYENINNRWFLENKSDKLINLLLPPETIINELRTNIKLFDKPTLFVEWNLPENARLLVVGDVHGDVFALSNLISHWSKNGFIDDNGILEANTYLVSLGDLVDYVRGSITVLHTFTKLRTLNPDKVMLLVGNHEGFTSASISGRDIFLQEFKKGTNEKNSFIKLLPLIGPSMLSVRFGNDDGYYYMMHGMFPVVNFDIFEDVNKKIKRKVKGKTIIEIITDKKFVGKKYVYWPDPIVDTYNKNETTNYTTAVQWNDVSINDNTTQGKRGIDYCLTIGKDILEHVMTTNKIKAFIRGHQDGCPTQHGMVDPGTCKNTVATHVAVSAFNNDYDNKRLECKKDKDAYEWCTFKVGVKGVSQDVWKRIFTTSMADQKPESDAPPGGYVCITRKK